MTKQTVEIKKDEDKATVAAILFQNGYTVRKVKIVEKGGRGESVGEFWKEAEK